MSDARPTWRRLLAGDASGVDEVKLAAALQQSSESEPHPLLVRIFSGIGAWVSAFFMLLFLTVAGLYDSSAACAVVGGLVLVGSLALSRAGKNVFVEQAALAAVLIGNGLILSAVAQSMNDWDDSIRAITLAQGVIAVIASLAFLGPVGRFICIAAVPVLAVVWATTHRSPFSLQLIVATLALATAGVYGWNRRPERWTVLGHVLFAALPGTVLFIEILRDFQFYENERIQTPVLPASIAVAVALWWLIIRYADGAGGRVIQRAWFWLAVVTIVLLTAFTTPGIVVALLLLLIAHAEDNRVMSALAYLFLAGFLFLFYYSLHVDLAQKSWIIAGSGVLMFVIRWFAGRISAKEAAP